MTKQNKIVYWVVTGWLALGMLSSGVVQVLNLSPEQKFTVHLGYPLYFITILGAWKILGAAAVLVPKRPVLKEWAYAGFFFCMSGAILSHIARADSVKELLPALLLLVLTILSWYFRPADRKTLSRTEPAAV